jgi:retron-type reverse transcriptase
MNKAKPFDIPKREVWEAFKHVKANQGAAGVDGQSIIEFEADLSNNFYKLWNRLSSGSYIPPPVRRVEIPKANGGTRPLGIPTVADRIAQEIARRFLEPYLEPVFRADSYGYRPGRSALDAVRTARERCWRYDWVLDLDIKGFFDSIDWELLLKAVHHHTDCSWALLYIERWLKAPEQMEDGSVVPRTAGTPQGGQSAPGESVSALCVRHVDDANLPAHSIRALRGRHHLSLQKRRRGAGTMERTCGSPCGLQAEFVSREDKDRLLQGCKSARRFPEPIVRLPRLHIPSKKDHLARAYPCARLHARDEPGGAEGHESNNSALGASSSQRQIPARAGSDVQSVHPRLD